MGLLSSGLTFHPPQVPIRRDADQEFVVDLLVDLELWVGLEVVVDGGLGVVARSPGAVGEHIRGQVFDSSPAARAWRR